MGQSPAKVGAHRLRNDETTADRLDRSNTALKRMLSVVEYERQRTFMQLTPREGLRIALRRADFIEARRYAAAVLRSDEEDPEANFGTFRSYAGRAGDTTRPRSWRGTR